MGCVQILSKDLRNIFNTSSERLHRPPSPQGEGKKSMGQVHGETVICYIWQVQPLPSALREGVNIVVPSILAFRFTGRCQRSTFHTCLPLEGKVSTQLTDEVKNHNKTSKQHIIRGKL